MKKLLITVIGAAAALGASAGTISTQRFEGETVDTTKTIVQLNNGREYWSGDDVTNKYTITGVDPSPDYYPIENSQPERGLDIKTTFGNPLTLNAVDGGTATNIPASGLYFDSVVKFTVCDEDQNTAYEAYNGAKIIMWIEQNEDGSETNLIVRAGHLTMANSEVVSTPTNYECELPDGFNIDAWHRVTIKAINDITVDRLGVPGFAIYIDKDADAPVRDINCTEAKFGGEFTEGMLTKSAKWLNKTGALFPSLDVATGAKLESVSFDGTGAITDLIFTDVAPAFAGDREEAEPIIRIGDQEFTTVEEAIACINNTNAPCTFALVSDLSLAAPIEFNNQTAAITLDFAGHVITNTLSDAIITNNAANLIITNSTETVGGINCLGTGAAIYQAAGALAITAGNFWGENLENGAVLVAEGYSGNTKFISGGAFASNMGQEVDYLVDGKTFADQPNTDGLYPVIDKITVTYTVKFVYGKPDGSYTQQFQVVENEMPTEPNAETVAVEGWTFNGWDTTVVAATADATYTAQYTLASWVGLLGQPVNGAYVIKNLDDLVLFKNGVAQLGTSGETFKLGADIDATDLGYFDGIGTASGTNGSSGLNNCTFDGAGHTISNVKFTNAKYRGFFNQVLNSTIKDLTINVVDIQQTDAAEHGYSAFAGNMKNSKIQNCVATGTIGTTAKPAMHTCGGFAVKSAGGNVFENCTNYVDVVCSLNDNPKIGGIVGLAQDGAAAFTNCWNYGDITITCKKCANAGNGAGGLVGYGSKAITIYGGGNAGTIQSTDTTAEGGTYPIKVGTIIAMQNDASATVTGGVVAQADKAPAGAFANISGLDFATVDGNVATFVDTLAAGKTYKVMNAAATATFAFAEAGTISFDTALATPTYAITAAEGLTLTDNTVGTVKTYTAAVPVPSGIDPTSSETPSAVVTAADADAAIEAVKVVAPTGVNAAEYKSNFDFTATSKGDGTFEVTLTGIKDEVQTAVDTTAAAVLDGTAESVTIPAGLFYKITPSTALPISGEATTGQSTGAAIPVTKPGTTQGFIEVKLGTQTFAE